MNANISSHLTCSYLFVLLTVFSSFSPITLQIKRFHLDWGKYNHKADKDEEAKKFVEEYTYDPKGFLKWCKSIDDEYIKDEAKSRFIGSEVLELFKKIPCVSCRLNICAYWCALLYYALSFSHQFLSLSLHLPNPPKQCSTVISLDISNGTTLQLQRRPSLICRLIFYTMRTMHPTLTRQRIN